MKKRHKTWIDFKKEFITYVKKHTLFMSVFLIIISAFLVYNNSLNGQFVWDDYEWVRDNTYIKSWSNTSKIFTKGLGRDAGKQDLFYRPIQTLTYMLDYSLWKLNVQGYHFTNILLHALAALSLYWLITILFNNRFLSLFTSLMFVIHPVHTEAVAYISGRADSLALLFMLLCFIFYIKQQCKNATSGYYILMVLSYTLALLSRENSLILPALLMLYHYSFKKRFEIKEFLPILLITLIYISLRVTALKFFLPHAEIPTTLFQRMPGFLVAIVNYLRLLFLPVDLHMEYGARLFTFTDYRVLLGAIMLFALLGYAFKKRKDDKLISFSIFWFFLTLLPSSNLYPINAYMAEHWLYLPSIGVFLILSKGIAYAYQSKGARNLTICLIIVLLASYFYLTIKQNEYWKEPISFYERTLKYAPDSHKIYSNLGGAYKDIGKKEEAMAFFKKAIKIKPDYAYAYNNLGFLHYNMGEWQKAIAFYKKAIAVDPDFASAYYNLGIVYQDTRRPKEAISMFNKTIEADPDFAMAYNNLGHAYRDNGKVKEAIDSYKRAIETDSNFAAAYNNLANAYSQTGKKQEAIALYIRAIEIDANCAEAYNGLGVVFYNLGRINESISLFRKAITINPNFTNSYNNLNKAYNNIDKD
ncbi:MAG: tetratricopeptide repeat protein [Candidatus Omnitrophica bacterium]|nr:tetratricopeptide repeat protein [Candidatus Omnitrophota bacterium]